MMDITRYDADIAIAQLALKKSLLDTVVSNRQLLCEVYCIPSHQDQAFYVQIYDGDEYTLLYAKPYISDYTGLDIVMYEFGEAILADMHPARIGAIYCGIKHIPKDNKYISMLTDCLPLYNEFARPDGFIVDGVFTLIRNDRLSPPAVLAYKTPDSISVNQYSIGKKVFLENLHLHIESIIGNLLVTNYRRSPREQLFLAFETDRRYQEFWHCSSTAK